MKNELDFNIKLSQVIEEFKRNGADDNTVKAIRMVAKIERHFLSEASIFLWLKEQALKSRLESHSKSYKERS